MKSCDSISSQSYEVGQLRPVSAAGDVEKGLKLRTMYFQSGLRRTHDWRCASQSAGPVLLPGSFQLWKIWWMILGTSCGRGSGVVALWAALTSSCVRAM